MTKSANSKIKALVAITLVLVMVLGVFAGCVNNSAISLDKTEHTMYVADNISLKATAPEGAQITWTSSDDKVATVRRGVVTAVGVGEAIITASLESGESATCKITVLNRTVSISQSTATIDLDSDNWTVTLSATASDGGAITWSSSNSTIATVSGGVVTATGNYVGDVTITAQRGAATAECVVTIEQPSRPNWKLLESKNNGSTVAAPGIWAYYAEGASTFTYAIGQAPYSDGNSVGVTFDQAVQPADDDQSHFTFRYQPDYALNTDYVLSFTVEISADVNIKYGQPTGSSQENVQYGNFKNVKIKANTAKEIVYFGTVGTVEPFSIRINEADGALDGVSFKLTNISIRERMPGEVEPDPERPEAENPGDVYDLVWGDKSTTVNHPNRWYYMVDGGSNGKGEGEVDGTPNYNNGTVTLALSTTTAGKTYQLRYQPDMEYGTLYTVKFTVNVSAQADILAGLDDSNKTFTGIEVGQDVELELDCYVSAKDPFHIELRNFVAGQPITLIVKDVEFIEREDDGGYNLAWGGKGDVSGNKGTWYYMVNSGSGQGAEELAATPTYKDGVVTMSLKSTTSGMAYQLRYQPNFADGASYKITFKVKVSAQAWLIIGNDAVQSTYPDGATSGAGIYCAINTEYTITHDGTVTNGDPFYIELKVANNDDAITITVYDIQVEEVSGGDGPIEQPGDDEYNLPKRSNGETVANPGEWAYTAPDAANLNSTPTYKEGVLTMDIASFVNADNYQFRFQPTWTVGTQYVVVFTVKLESASNTVYFLFGGNGESKNSKDWSELVDNGDGTVTVTYVGTVGSSNPFMIQPKTSSTDEPVAVKITVTNISFTEKKNDTEDDNGDQYNLTNRTNGETISNAGEWAYNAPGNVNFKSAPSYNDGVLTMDIEGFVNGDNLQFRFQPTWEVGTQYTVTFTVKLESDSDTVYFLFGGNGDSFNSKDNPAVTNNGDGTYTVTYTGTVGSSNPFMVQPKTSSTDQPVALKITVTIISFEQA